MTTTPPEFGPGPIPVGSPYFGLGLVDTHCHLVLLEERGLLSEALESMEAGRVEVVVSVGLNVHDSELNLQMAERIDAAYFSVGWHPTEPTSPTENELAEMEKLLSHPKAVAVGEIGLDYFFRPGYHEVDPAIQERSMRAMCELALSTHKPILIHDRDAHAAVLAVLDGYPGLTGIMHCFSGDSAFARAVVERGFVIACGGAVTYKPNDKLRDAVASVGPASYVLETDAPFLPPQPVRGKPNLPGYVAHTANHVALVRGVDPSVVAAQSTLTVARVLDIPGLEPATR